MVAWRICCPSPCASAWACSWIPDLTDVRAEFAHWEAQGDKLVPYRPLAGVPRARNASSAGASQGEAELAGTGGKQWSGHGKLPFGQGAEHPPRCAPTCCCRGGWQGWAIFGGGCLGCCRGQEGRGSCALWLLSPLPPLAQFIYRFSKLFS